MKCNVDVFMFVIIIITIAILYNGTIDILPLKPTTIYKHDVRIKCIKADTCFCSYR